MTRARHLAVIGAGVAGLACGRALNEAGATVTVFEREAYPSGRAATLIDGLGPYDHGAQYFTAVDERFAAAVARWQSDGVVQRWTGRIIALGSGGPQDTTQSAERFVAVPGMRRLGVHLALGLDVRYSTLVTGLKREADGWKVLVDGQADGFGPFDAVLVAFPGRLAAALLDGLTDLAEQVRAVTWDPCWAVTVALAQASGFTFEGAFINDDPILGWAALDSAKPRRGQVSGVAERWVLHSKPQWSRRYIDLEESEAARWMVRAFSARLRGSLAPLKVRALRWSHATPVDPLPGPCLWDEAQRLGAAGDWCCGARIEGAYLSGLALAEAALR